MTVLAILLGVIFFLACFIFVAGHACHLGRLTLLDWSILGIGGVYGLGWSLVVFVTDEGGNPFWSQWLISNKNLYVIHTASATMLAVSIWFGWLLLGKRCPILQKVSSITLRRYNVKITSAMWFLLICAFITQWLYTRAYGGFIEFLFYSASIRSAIFPVGNTWSFLQPFGGMALFSSFGFFGLWLSGWRKLRVSVGFLLSFLFSLYLLYSWLGRMGFIIYIAAFVLALILMRQPRPLKLLFIGSGMMFFILVSAHYLSLWLHLKSAESLLAFIAKEISFPFGSFFAQLNSGEHLFRFFKDFILVPIYFLPSSLWTHWIVDVSQVNTTVLMGAPKGTQGVTGGIPVDLLTLSMMQVSILGIPIVGISVGAFFRIIQHLLDNIGNPGVRNTFEAYIVFKIALLGIFYAQPSLFIKSNFPLFLTAIVIAVFLKLPRLKWNLSVTPRCNIK